MGLLAALLLFSSLFADIKSNKFLLQLLGLGGEKGNEKYKAIGKRQTW